MNIRFNIWLNNVFGSDAFVADIQALITKCQAAGCDVLLVVPIPRGVRLSATLANQAAYQAAIRQLGVANNAPVVDLIQRFGSYTAAANLFVSDQTHLADIGYADKARGVFSRLVS